MKISFVFLLIGLFVFSQENKDEMYYITYISSFKIQDNWKKPGLEYSRLLVKNDKSIFQTYKVMQLDSLRVKGIATDSDINKFFSFNDYTIKIYEDKIFYSEAIGGKNYIYNERVDFDWTLLNESKTIKGYSCLKAVVNYGGRNWTAWYTTDLPLNAGPYKFKGLPGLILEMYDATNSFSFKLYGLIEGKARPLKKLYQHEESQKVKTTKEEFTLFKQKYYEMSLNEKLSLNSPSKVIAVNLDSSDDSELRNSNYNRAYNFIELLEN